MTEPRAPSSKPAGKTPPTPGALRGLWRREEIFTPSGYRDTTTRVLWLQTERYYGDIRVQADRPQRPGAGFEAYSDEELIKLAAVQGFGGVLSADADVCLWRRDLDYQPPGLIPDEARFDIDADRMGEYGIHAEYTEIWRRQAQSAHPLAAFRLQGAPSGILVIGGEHVLEIRDREQPLVDGADLAEIVARHLADGRRDLAIQALQMRICYGRIGKEGEPWRVELSTLPWLEGGPFFPLGARFDPATGRLDSGRDRWELLEATSSPSALAPLFETLTP